MFARLDDSIVSQTSPEQSDRPSLVAMETKPMHLLPAALIDIEFSDVSVAVDDGGGLWPCRRPTGKKQLLRGVSGRFQSGELTAIMGPSGAGKTTLLNVLTGYSTKGMSGCVRALGSMGAGGCLLRKQSCYIMQDDHLLPHLTVMESLELAAKLHLPRGTSPKKRRLVMDNILDTLRLGSGASVRCGSLSGGQKKRLSIALELVKNPPVIFLDEPTTGLDSSSSVQCVGLLRQLARGGRTVVMTLHQPSAFLYEMLDHVYVLGQGGQCVYTGAPEMTVAYLAHVGLPCPLYHSPADFMIEAASGDLGDHTKKLVDAVKADSSEGVGDSRWRRRRAAVEEEGLAAPQGVPYRKSSDVVAWEATAPDEATRVAIEVQVSSEGVDERPVSELSKYRILLGRALWQIHCEWTVSRLRAAFHLMVGALLGALYSGAGTDGGRTFSNLSFLLVSLVYLSYTAMMPAVLRFPSELPVIQKEHFNNWYSLSAYYAAYLTANTPVQMIHCLLFCSVAYFGSGQPNESQRFFMYLLICELVMLRAEGWGLLLGSWVNSVNGTFLGALTTAVDIVLAGYIALISDMPPIFQSISHLSYMRQGYEGMLVSLYGFGRSTLPCPEDQDADVGGRGTYCHLRYPSKILETFSASSDNYWTKDVVVLLVWVVALRVAVFYSLRKRMASG